MRYTNPRTHSLTGQMCAVVLLDKGADVRVGGICPTLVSLDAAAAGFGVL